MIIQPYDYFLIAWFVLAALSTAYVAVDQFLNNPEPAVMKWGFILVTVYTGPLGLLLYVLADKEPRPGEHEAFVKAVWKQGVRAPGLVQQLREYPGAVYCTRVEAVLPVCIGKGHMRSIGRQRWLGLAALVAMVFSIAGVPVSAAACAVPMASSPGPVCRHSA